MQQKKPARSGLFAYVSLALVVDLPIARAVLLAMAAIIVVAIMPVTPPTVPAIAITRLCVNHLGLAIKIWARLYIDWSRLVVHRSRLVIHRCWLAVNRVRVSHAHLYTRHPDT